MIKKDTTKQMDSIQVSGKVGNIQEKASKMDAKISNMDEKASSNIEGKIPLRNLKF